MDKEKYMSLPHDLSGAMSKNRFRNEMLWGLSLIFESYLAQKNFVVVFDYVCDIELHADGTFAFYRLKTSSGTSPYSVKKLTKCYMDVESNHSILGKLFLIKNSFPNEDNNFKVAVVSNVPIKLNGKVYANSPELCVGSVGEEVVSEFVRCLKNEFPNETEFDFSSVYYILSTIDLFNPHDTLLEKTVTFYQKVTGKEPTKPNTLYRTFTDIISNCACYEMEAYTYEELIAHKGITTIQISNILKQYSDNANDSVEKCKGYIETLYCNDFGTCVRAKRALDQIVIDLQTNVLLQAKEQEIQKWIMQNLHFLVGDKSEIANRLMEYKADSFPIEYSRIQIWAMFILILTRIEEGVYEKSNG